jgi:hypothetical protein
MLVGSPEFMFCDLHHLPHVDKHLVGGQFYYLHQRHEYSEGRKSGAIKAQNAFSRWLMRGAWNTMLSRGQRR